MKSLIHENQKKINIMSKNFTLLVASILLMTNAAKASELKTNTDVVTTRFNLTNQFRL